eukprot:CAMPEP_0202465506 /NCGR_PEP_ID=MMETSP1360-20130828/65844_1 /ASSEMBLY_ACC=CAM_ASM_000848 /TAXON_ID=515479 /ORGANISM="Licmophora paradoxa, Strain CCMP2313" /LENGTH=38 /DNA_ID= /DNA_START= /DNA_END= /DNA_ORIENTATION=
MTGKPVGTDETDGIEETDGIGLGAIVGRFRTKKVEAPQ